MYVYNIYEDTALTAASYPTPSLMAMRRKGTARVRSEAMALRSFCFSLFTVAIWGEWGVV